MGKTGNIMGTLLHTSRNILHLISRQDMQALCKNLSKATDNVKGGTDLMVHILYKASLLTVGLQFKLVGTGKFIVLLLQFGIDTTDGGYTLGKRLLHADETVCQPAYAVIAGTLRQRLVKLSFGNTFGLFIKLAQRLHGSMHYQIAEKHKQQ